MEEGRLNRLAKLVEKDVYKVILWTYQKVSREKFAHDEMMHNIRVAVFEAWSDAPESPDKDLVKSAAQKCKHWYMGPQTAYADHKKRSSFSKSRMKIFASDEQAAIPDPMSQIDLHTLYKVLVDVCGHEVAVLYILKEGYDCPTTKIVENVLGIPKDSDEFHAQRKRVDRLQNLVRKALKEKLYASRESRKLLNI